MSDGSVAAAKEQLSRNFRERVRFDEDDLQAIRERHNAALRPRDRAFGTKRRRGAGASSIRQVLWRDVIANLRSSSGFGVKVRATIARLRGTKYFLATPDLLGRDGEKSVEYRVDAFRIAVEQSEAREVVHQAEAGHVGAHAAFEHRIIIRAEFHLHRIEFVERYSLLLHFA